MAELIRIRPVLDADAGRSDSNRRQADGLSHGSNVVENALHYGGQAALTLTREGATVVLAVEDDGPGIPEDELVHVLQPFHRLDSARARNTAGLGLGLTIVQQILQREGGALVLKNRPEGGLRVELRLPAL